MFAKPAARTCLAVPRWAVGVGCPEWTDRTPCLGVDDRERSSDVDLVVDALRQLPIGHEVEWGDRHQRLTASVWRASWIDVVVPDVCEHVGMNWLWTIVTPDDGDAPDEPADSTTIALAPDCDVHTWIDPETGWFAETGPVHVTAPGVPVSDEQHAEIAAHG